MNDSHIHVYKKDELPDRWHYSKHRLVPPITVTADVGWFILTVSQNLCRIELTKYEEYMNALSKSPTFLLEIMGNDISSKTLQQYCMF